jgi:hypothetical protein
MSVDDILIGPEDLHQGLYGADSYSGIPRQRGLDLIAACWYLGKSDFTLVSRLVGQSATGQGKKPVGHWK